MAYIRKKTYKRKSRNGRQQPDGVYYYVVQTYRLEGKVKQQTVAYLGEHDTVEGAIRATLARKLRLQRDLGYWKDRAAELETGLKPVIDRVQMYGYKRASIGRNRRKQHQTLQHIRAILDKAPDEIERCTQRLAVLRNAADLLGITDPEALALDGTEAYNQVVTRVSQMRQRDEWGFIARDLRKA